VQNRALGRGRVTEAYVFETDFSLEFGQAQRTQLLDDSLAVIEILKYTQRSSQSLLENVVNTGEALDGLIDHQERDHERRETAGAHAACFHLNASVGEQQNNRHGAEQFDERRCHSLLRDVSKIARPEFAIYQAEAVGFEI